MREIGHGSSLFLLYGETGVGKSSLLRQLSRSRLQNQTVHYLNFEEQTADNLDDSIQAIADSAGEADVLIFDHFEAASNKAQHQIFKSWSTDGRDRKLNFIVSSSSSGFNVFRQLAQQFHIEAKSFQLMPCSEVECEAFLHFRLYPERPFGELIIPATIKRLIRQSQGLFSSLVEIAERDGGSISIRVDNKKPSRNAAVAIIILLALIIVGAGSFYYMDTHPIAEVMPESEPEPKFVPESKPEPELKPEPEPEPEPESELETFESPEPSLSWMQASLQSSLDWIEDSDSKRGTIQIMSVSTDRFDDKAFESLITDLKVQGVDVTQVRIFKTKAADQELYSLIYGDFASRREAGKQIGLLPEILAGNGPIPRSVGSIARNIAKYSSN